MSIMQTFRDGPRQPIRATWLSRTNWPVFWTGQLWWLLETAHFGWNLMPASDAELICDGIFLVIMAMAWGPAVNGA